MNKSDLFYFVSITSKFHHEPTAEFEGENKNRYTLPPIKSTIKSTLHKWVRTGSINDLKQKRSPTNGDR